MDLCIGQYVSKKGTSTGISEMIFELDQVVLVFTDIQDSTLMAAEDAYMYKQASAANIAPRPNALRGNAL